MKNRLIKILIFSLFAFTSFSFTNSTPVDVIFKLVTYNGYGNNLYFDNLSIGKIPGYDVSVAAIYNVNKDTTFIADSAYSIVPLKVVLINTGSNTVTNIQATLYLDLLAYQKTDTIASLGPGQAYLAAFDTLPIPTGRAFNLALKIYSPNDSVAIDDSLSQSSIFLRGAKRNVLLEEFTNSGSNGCLIMDPYLDIFVNNNIENICAIRYHTRIPNPPYDSMYLADTLQSDQRRNYYYTNAVPTSFLDGSNPLPLPYSLDSILYSALYERQLAGSPLSMSVTDLRLPGDTIQTTIDVNVLFPLSPVGDYRLRVMGIERLVSFSVPIIPGGQVQYFDVFRTMIPDSAGIRINTSPGTYEYVFKYYKNPLWVDSMVYTTAFVQDDNFKTVLNSAKARSYTNYKNFSKPPLAHNLYKSDYLFLDNNRPASNYFKPKYSPLKNVKVNKYPDTLSYREFEAFEGTFPPAGWYITNSDGYFSFEKFKNINGPTLGGFASLRFPFYDYSNIGAKDTLISASFHNVTSNDTLTFDWAYAPYMAGYDDSLECLVSTDNGASWTSIFYFGGLSLATAPSSTMPFAPSGNNEWSTYKYPMSAILSPKYFSADKNITFRINQNYPNPFNPKTTISYLILQDNYASMYLYDITGRRVATLINNEYRRQGNYSLDFNASNLSSGVYFYVMTAAGYRVTMKMLLVK